MQGGRGGTDRGADTIGSSDRCQAEGDTPSVVGDHGQGVASDIDRLDYLIDLIMQLRDLAQDGGLQRLALILMLAEQEARQQLGRPVQQSARL